MCTETVTLLCLYHCFSLFCLGEGIKTVAAIQNKSSRPIRPKYCLYLKYSYFAKGKRRVQTKDILKEVGEAIPPSACLSVTRVITIPSTTCVSILNCNIIKVEYRLRVCISPLKTSPTSMFLQFHMISTKYFLNSGLSWCQVCFRPWGQVSHSRTACITEAWRGAPAYLWVWSVCKLRYTWRNRLSTKPYNLQTICSTHTLWYIWDLSLHLWLWWKILKMQV